jgi:hypothetical protein
MRVHARIPQEVKGLLLAEIDGFVHEIDEAPLSGMDAEALDLLRVRRQKIFIISTLPNFPGVEAERFSGPEPLLIKTVPIRDLDSLRKQSLGLPKNVKV